MTTTAPATHVVYLSRRLVRRMEIGACARAHRAATADDRRIAKSYANYLEQSLRVRGETIEIRGPMDWIERMAVVCGDVPAALEIGRQLQADV